MAARPSIEMLGSSVDTGILSRVGRRDERGGDQEEVSTVIIAAWTRQR
jgi:hypothetical protein